MTLLWRIDGYLKRTGMPVTKFGRLAVNDPRFVLDLRNGRQPSPRTTARVDHFLAQEPR